MPTVPSEEIWAAVAEANRDRHKAQQRFRREPDAENVLNQNYVVLRYRTLQHLEAGVQMLIDLGFQPVGGVQIEARVLDPAYSLHGGYKPETWYLQSMFAPRAA